jgi:hypothetical protein
MGAPAVKLLGVCKVNFKQLTHTDRARATRSSSRLPNFRSAIQHCDIPWKHS